MRLHSRWISVSAFLVAATSTVVAQAHPGHGTTNPDSPAHLLEPVHFISLAAGVAVLAAAAAGLVVYQRRKLAEARSAANSDRSRRVRHD